MDSRRHKKAGYPLHMKGATDTFSFKPTVITYNEANIQKITEEHSIYLFSEKIACSSATVEPTGCLFSPRIPNQFRNLVIQAVCLDQFLQRDVHPVSPIMV